MTLSEAVFIHREEPEFLARIEAKRDPNIVLRLDEIDEQIYRLEQEKKKIVEDRTKDFLPEFEEKVKEAREMIAKELDISRSEG